MCGRYVSPDEAAIKRAWDLIRGGGNPFTRNFNVAPSTQVPLLRLDPHSGRLELTSARWGLIPVWWKEAKLPFHTINARSEEAASKPMWRHPFRQARCLMPAEGWYEWQKIERVDPETGEVTELKQPHYIYRKDGKPFCFAGLMAFWTPPGQTEAVLSCALLTRGASPAVAKVHDRMPVVLPDAMHGSWLNPELTDAAKIAALVHDCAVDDFSHHPVSRRVNSPKNKDADLVARVE